MDFVNFKNWCKNVSFYSVITLVTACGHDNLPDISFQEFVDRQKNPYQFAISDYPINDIKALKANNINLATAQNRITVSQALYDQAFAGYLPQISADFSANRQSFVNPFNFQPGKKQNLYSLGGQFRLTPDFFGRTTLQTDIADNQLLANYFQAQSTYLDIINGYAKTYHLVCATKKRLGINENTVKLNRDLAQSTQVRYNMGRTNAVDYYSAIERSKIAQIAFNRSKQNYNLALESYYNLIGQSVPDTNTLCEKGHFPELPSENIVISVADLDKRPDIKVAQYNTQIATDIKDLSIRAFFPDPAIIFDANNIGNSIDDVFNIQKFATNLIGQFSLLIYDGGVRSSQLDISEADLKLAEKTYQDAVIRAGNNIISLGKNFTLAKRLLDKTQQRFDAAQKAFKAAQNRYQYGRLPFQDLLNIQNNYYAAQIELIAVQQNIRDIYSDLLTASGTISIGVDI